MTVDPAAAYEFLQGYKQLLLRLSGQVEDNRHNSMLGQLHMGREVLVATPGGPGSVLAELSDDGTRIPENVASAIQSLQVEYWVYLRDTKHQSIFVHPESTAAYGVLGLTDPIRTSHHAGYWYCCPYRDSTIPGALRLRWAAVRFRISGQRLSQELHCRV